MKIKICLFLTLLIATPTLGNQAFAAGMGDVRICEAYQKCLEIKDEICRASLSVCMEVAREAQRQCIEEHCESDPNDRTTDEQAACYQCTRDWVRDQKECSSALYQCQQDAQRSCYERYPCGEATSA